MKKEFRGSRKRPGSSKQSQMLFRVMREQRLEREARAIMRNPDRENDEGIEKEDEED